MNLRSRIILFTLCGLFAGGLLWILTEFGAYWQPILWVEYEYTPQPNWLESLLGISGKEGIEGFRAVLHGIIFGVLLSLGFGWVDSLNKAGSAKTRLILAAAVCGFFGGWLSHVLAGVLYRALGGNPAISSAGFLSFINQLVARSVAWGVLGLLLGALQGTYAKSLLRARHAAIGGAIGGLIGGFLFEVLGIQLTTLSGQLGGHLVRLIGYALVGGLIGLFIGLIENLMKNAWIRVVAGRNEGREYLIEKPIFTLGRSELCDAALFGDSSVAPLHANIIRQQLGYVIGEGSPGVSIAVNNQPVAGYAGLRDGDVIQIGSHQILFFEKATAPKFAQRAAPDMVPQPLPDPASFAAPGQCPYCGQMKDTAGACACSVGLPVAPGAGSLPAYQPAPPDPFGRAPAAIGTLAMPPGAMPDPSLAPIFGAAPAGLKLFCVEGQYAGSEFPIPPAGLTIGRELGRAVVLDQDSTVSRKHATITVGPSGASLVDEGSSNGTFVNGARVNQSSLSPGDVIQIGRNKFLLSS